MPISISKCPIGSLIRMLPSSTAWLLSYLVHLLHIIKEVILLGFVLPLTIIEPWTMLVLSHYFQTSIYQIDSYIIETLILPDLSLTVPDTVSIFHHNSILTLPSSFARIKRNLLQIFFLHQNRPTPCYIYINARYTS